jgi:hypothetical protein
MANCRHCQSPINPEQKCLLCGEPMIDQCKVCHEEVTHDVIRNQNIHLCSSPDRKFNAAEDDPDAFGGYED